MPVPTFNPQSLAALKRLSIPVPGTDGVSANIAEGAPGLLADSGAVPGGGTPRNSAIAGALRTKYGLGPDQGDMSQQDLELLDKFFRGHDVADKIAVETAPEKLKYQDSINAPLDASRIAQDPLVSAEANKAYQEKLGLAGEGARVAAEGNLAVEKQKQAPMMEYLSGRATAGGPENGQMQFRPTITENGITLSGISEPTQVMAQQHAAQIGLSQYPAMRQIIDTLNKHGLIGPAAGRFADAATSTGLDSYLLSPESRRAFNDFKAQASLMKSNMALVHGGSRGGGSPAIAARFDQLVNMAQSPEALKGAIDAFERWQTKYANAKSSAEMDAADAELGVTGGPYTGGNQGDPWSTPPTPAELGTR